MDAGVTGVTVFWAATAEGIEANAIAQIKIPSTCETFTDLMMHENSRDWIHGHHVSVRRM